MSKINIPRFVNTSKTLATKTGQELREFIEYTTNATEQIVRAVRKNLTFEDNFKAENKRVTLLSGAATAIRTTGKPTGILPLRVVDQAAGIESFNWYIDASGTVVVDVVFTNTTTEIRTLDLLILF